MRVPDRWGWKPHSSEVVVVGGGKECLGIVERIGAPIGSREVGPAGKPRREWMADMAVFGDKAIGWGVVSECAGWRRWLLLLGVAPGCGELREYLGSGERGL